MFVSCRASENFLALRDCGKCASEIFESFRETTKVRPTCSCLFVTATNVGPKFQICVFGRAGDPITFEHVVSLCESGNKASEIFVSFRDSGVKCAREFETFFVSFRDSNNCASEMLVEVCDTKFVGCYTCAGRFLPTVNKTAVH